MSTLGLPVVAKASQASWSDFVQFKAESPRDVDTFFNKIIPVADMEDSSTKEALGVLHHAAGGRDFAKERQYFFVSPVSRGGMIKLDQPYYREGEPDLVFEATASKQPKDYFYIRSYVVSKAKDRFLKVVRFGAKGVRLRDLAGERPPEGDDAPDYLGVKSADGVLLGFNRFGAHVILAVKGRKVEQASTGQTEVLMMDVDDLLIQCTMTKLGMFLKGRTAGPSDETVLKKHMAWELAYQEETLGSHLASSQSFLPGPGGRTFSCWEFDMPERLHANKPDRVKRNMFVETRVGDAVLVLGGALSDLKLAGAMRKKLEETAFSLRDEGKPVSVRRLKALALKT